MGKRVRSHGHRADPVAPAAAIVVLLALVALPAPLPALEEWRAEAEQETLRMPEGTDLATLVGRPTEIDSGVVGEDDEAVAASFADVHAVYDVDPRVLRETIMDLDSQEQFVPHVEESRAERTGDDPPRWIQRIRIAVGVLFFEAGYELDNEYLVVQRDDDRFGMVFRMAESHDDMLADTYGSWYLEAVEVNGMRGTYVRYFSHVAFAEHVVGLRIALELFGLNNVIAVMDAYVDEARRRGG